jgi:hypothetical protein
MVTAGESAGAEAEAEATVGVQATAWAMAAKPSELAWSPVKLLARVPGRE